LRKKDLEKKDLLKTVIEEINGDGAEKQKKKRSIWKVIQIPTLAIFTGLILGAILIAATSFTVYDAFKVGFFNGIGTAFAEIGKAYWGLFTGSLGNPAEFINAVYTEMPRTYVTQLTRSLKAWFRRRPTFLPVLLALWHFGLVFSILALKDSFSWAQLPRLLSATL